MGAQIVIYGPSGSGLTDFERVAPEGVEVGWVDSSLPMEDQAAELRDAQVMIVAGAHVSVEVARHAPNELSRRPAPGRTSWTRPLSARWVFASQIMGAAMRSRSPSIR